MQVVLLRKDVENSVRAEGRVVRLPRNSLFSFSYCPRQSAVVCASHCPRAATTNVDLAATPPGKTAVNIDAAAMYDNVT